MANQSHFGAAVVGLSVVLGLWTATAWGQSAAHAKAAAHSGLTCEDVIKLAKAGLAEDIIIEQIKKNGKAFNLSTDQLVALKTANVSDRIVEAMLDPTKTFVSEPAPAPVVPKTVAVVTPEPQPVKHAAVEPEPRTVREQLPTEIGVYVKNHGHWDEVAPEIVYWKTGGVLKTVATAGIRHGDVNGHIPGSESRTHLPHPKEFLIIAPEGTALAEYQLLHLRRNTDNREFRTVTGGWLHAQSGAQRDLVQFDGKKLSSGVFEVTFPGESSPGEYGFLPPGSNGGNGKIYSFQVE